MHVVIVKSKVKPDKVAIYEQTFRELREKVLANEPFVTFYELCRVPDSDHEYRVVEAYSDSALQEQHLGTEYYQAASAVFMDCLVDGAFEMETVETV